MFIFFICAFISCVSIENKLFEKTTTPHNKNAISIESLYLKSLTFLAKDFNSFFKFSKLLFKSMFLYDKI